MMTIPLRAAALAVAAAACMAPAPATPPRAAPPAGGSTRSTDETQEVARMVNAHRARIGCPPLQWDAVAARAAQSHSEDMQRRRYFAHVSPDGGNVGSRLTQAGVRWRAVAENIASGQPTAVIVVRGWLSSAGHRANIENCVYTRHGVGKAGGLWTHVFYTPTPSPGEGRERNRFAPHSG
jgi:uncharacterized protein YkwD